MSENDELQSEEPRIVTEFTDGGHELDEPPSHSLLVYLIVLAVILLGVSLGVSQFFQIQSREMTREQLARVAELLEAQRAAEREALTTYGETAEPGRYRIPIERAMDLIASDSKRLARGPEPPGFLHPDDEMTGGPAGTQAPSEAAPAAPPTPPTGN